jgi:hypothetical protein
MCRRDQRAHLGRFLGGVPHHDAGYGRFEKGEELVIDRSLHENAGTGAAVLPRVVEDAVRGTRRGQLDVSVGEDNIGALAPQLECHSFYLVGATGHDGPAYLGGAGEADLADCGMGHETLAHDAAFAGQHLQHPFGESRLEGQLTYAQGAERSELGRLEDHRVACRQRGRKAPAGDRHGEVPRNDDPHHAERLVEGQVDPARDGYLAPAVPLGRGGVVLEHVPHVAGLPAGIPDDVTGVGHLERRQLLAMRVDRGGEAAQQAGPVAGCHMPPCLEGAGGAGDRRIHLDLTQGGDAGDVLTCRRVADEGRAALFVLHTMIIADDCATTATGVLDPSPS